MPDTQIPKTLIIETHGPEETQQVGRIIGEQARPGDVYLLTGPLGAGKTCLTQGLALGLGVPGHVRSPTFVLMTRYQGRLTLHHMDLYRIGGPLEAWDLGLDEYLLGDGVCVIEWADQAAEVFPEDALWINLDYPTIQPAGPVGKLRTGSELAEADQNQGASGGVAIADGGQLVAADGELVAVHGEPLAADGELVAVHGDPLADGGQPVTDGSDLVADGESLTVRGEPVEPGEQEDHRVISLDKHSSRYNSLWRKLAEAFPQIEASP